MGADRHREVSCKAWLCLQGELSSHGSGGEGTIHTAWKTESRIGLKVNSLYLGVERWMHSLGVGRTKAYEKGNSLNKAWQCHLHLDILCGSGTELACGWKRSSMVSGPGVSDGHPCWP